ncbi:DUF4375 domain-containing protein [Lysobacter yananisis]|uniref:DUF4375 domain-containing protein n=1 Tax=Lysobacter yananisis TaxID=1003114 RepID=A0ABY9PHM5_9GAMM|nr:DUF4375 domain-containing protein [Lysobacter yananisis]WMT05352.1 DUF4375 domain-containing protein [Lysobacter yananisis]
MAGIGALTSFKFVHAIHTYGLTPKAEREGRAALTVPERVVLLAWWARGVIVEGGFAQLYASSADLDEVADAFKTVGAEAAWQACLDAKAVFPDGPPPGKPDERAERMKPLASGDEAGALWDAQDRAVRSLGEAFDDWVAAYVREHQESFVGSLVSPWVTFFHGAGSAGLFEVPGPDKPGIYPYEANRGPAHYEMGLALESEGSAWCWLRQKDGTRLRFRVVGRHDGGLVLEDFSPE